MVLLVLGYETKQLCNVNNEFNYFNNKFYLLFSYEHFKIIVKSNVKSPFYIFTAIRAIIYRVLTEFYLISNKIIQNRLLIL